MQVNRSSLPRCRCDVTVMSSVVSISAFLPHRGVTLDFLTCFCSPSFFRSPPAPHRHLQLQQTWRLISLEYCIVFFKSHFLLGSWSCVKEWGLACGCNKKMVANAEQIHKNRPEVERHDVFILFPPKPTLFNVIGSGHVCLYVVLSIKQTQKDVDCLLFIYSDSSEINNKKQLNWEIVMKVRHCVRRMFHTVTWPAAFLLADAILSLW